MSDDQKPREIRKSVAEFKLPQGEGALRVSVKSEEADGDWGALPVTEVGFYHKPDGCGGPAGIRHIGTQKTVLSCHGCLLRMELRGAEGRRPITIQQLREVLAHMVAVEDKF